MLNIREENNNQTLPPPPVLWAWLSYIHRTTGQWPMPPDHIPNQPANSTNRYIYPFPSSSPDPKLHQPAGEAAEPGLTLHSPASSHIITNFSYVNSPYFLEAERLINLSTTPSLNPELLFGCKQTLSLIIAWCHHSLFNGTAQRQGQWMLLSFGQFARELHLRAANLKIYLDALEKAGLITLGSLKQNTITREEFERLRYDLTQTPHSFWPTRSLQEKSTIYRLNLPISPSLPIFNPTEITSGQLAKVGKDLEPLSTNPITPGKTLAQPDTNFNVLPTSFLSNSPCSWESNTNDDEIKIEKISMINRTAETVSLGLSEEQQAKFDFLDKTANFENFQRKDGRETLDRQQSLKFALDPNLTLEKITSCYNQVREMWLNGQCRKNPLGLLHWSLTSDGDPLGDNKNNLLKLENRQKSTLHNKNNNHNSAQPRNYARPFRKPSYSLPSFASQPQTDSVLTEEPVLVISGFDITNNLDFLWQEVNEDLVGRFRLSQEKLRLLDNSNLRFVLDNIAEPVSPSPKQAVITLRSILEERSLDLATRNTIAIALRQRIGAGYEIKFEV